MPKRTDLNSILGSGPIVIGQAAEFDYSGRRPSVWSNDPKPLLKLFATNHDFVWVYLSSAL
jgi:carbamoyl-phosphate synthase large subunit